MNNQAAPKWAFVLLGLLVALGGIGLWIVGRWLLVLEPEVAGPIIAAIFGFIGLIYGQWHSKSREIQQSHRPQKIEVYEEFFDILEGIVRNAGKRGKLEKGSVPEGLRDQFWRLNRGLIVWGSPQVIRCWLSFRRYSDRSSHVLLLMDDMLQAIRKDLGNSNIGLDRGDAIKVFLSDPSELEKTEEP